MAEQVRATVSDAVSDTKGMLPAVRCIPLALIVRRVVVEEHFRVHIVFADPFFVADGLPEWQHNCAQRGTKPLQQAAAQDSLPCDASEQSSSGQ